MLVRAKHRKKRVSDGVDNFRLLLQEFQSILEKIDSDMMNCNYRTAHILLMDAVVKFDILRDKGGELLVAMTESGEVGPGLLATYSIDT